jgi:putative transcriptional regulator
MPTTIKDLCVQYGLGQSAMARRFNIPLRTLQDWYSERRVPPAYVVEMMAQLLEIDSQKENKQ